MLSASVRREARHGQPLRSHEPRGVFHNPLERVARADELRRRLWGAARSPIVRRDVGPGWNRAGAGKRRDPPAGRRPTARPPVITSNGGGATAVIAVSE